jgi:serine/threonine protein phosphatase PrpC
VTPPLGLPVAAIRQLAALGGGLARSRFHIMHGQCSDVGLVRNNNEDAILSFFATQVTAGGPAHFGLFIVADGAGGHDDGEEAASTAVRVTAEQINRRIYLPLLDTAALGADSPPLLESLSEAVRAANRAVMQDVPGAGTTLTVALLMGDTVYLAHAGDSRAYLIAPHADTGQYGIECLTRGSFCGAAAGRDGPDHGGGSGAPS